MPAPFGPAMRTIFGDPAALFMYAHYSPETALETVSPGSIVGKKYLAASDSPFTKMDGVSHALDTFESRIYPKTHLTISDAQDMFLCGRTNNSCGEYYGSCKEEVRRGPEAPH